MTDIYDQNEEEFRNLCVTIEDNLHKVLELSGEYRKDCLREVESDIYQARKSLEAMDEEVRHLTTGFRAQFSAKLRIYKMDMTELETMYRARVNDDGDRDRANRDELLGSAYDETQLVDMDQRQRLIDGADRLEATSNILNRTNRTAEASVEIGKEVLSDLHGQTRQLERTKDNLSIVDENVKKSKRTMKSMAWRVITNKCLIFLIILVLIFGIFLIVFFVWIRPLIWKKK